MRGAKGESGRGSRGKGAERKGPDIFIALPTSFPHPSFHALFPGNGGQLGEPIRRMGESLLSSLTPGHSRLPLTTPPEGLGADLGHYGTGRKIPSVALEPEDEDEEWALGYVGGVQC